MKLIIDISEEQYELVRHGNKSYTTELELMNAVANGTPLPKGHGRLIDADAINIHDVSPTYGMEVYGVTQDDIEYAPTIIEAEEEGK